MRRGDAPSLGERRAVGSGRARAGSPRLLWPRNGWRRPRSGRSPPRPRRGARRPPRSWPGPGFAPGPLATVPARSGPPGGPDLALGTVGSGPATGSAGSATRESRVGDSPRCRPPGLIGRDGEKLPGATTVSWGRSGPADHGHRPGLDHRREGGATGPRTGRPGRASRRPCPSCARPDRRSPRSASCRIAKCSPATAEAEQLRVPDEGADPELARPGPRSGTAL